MSEADSTKLKADVAIARPCASKAVVEALRRLVEELERAPTESLEFERSATQIIGVFVFAINLVLIADLALQLLPAGGVLSKLLDVGVKILPVIIGTVLLTWLESLRKGLFGLAKNRPFNWSMGGLFALLIAVLLAPSMPISILVVLNPRDLSVQVDQKSVTMLVNQPAPQRLSLPGLGSHVITVNHRARNGANFPDTLRLGPWAILVAKLRQLPLVGRLTSGDSLELSTRYPVTFVPARSAGPDSLLFRGPFPREWAQTLRNQYGNPNDAPGEPLRFPLPPDKTVKIMLPPGKYYWTQGGCPDSVLQVDTAEYAAGRSRLVRLPQSCKGK